MSPAVGFNDRLYDIVPRGPQMCAWTFVGEREQYPPRLFETIANILRIWLDRRAGVQADGLGVVHWRSLGLDGIGRHNFRLSRANGGRRRARLRGFDMPLASQMAGDGIGQ
jgi:hypothetical protein